jgi:hypothetical protein
VAKATGRARSAATKAGDSARSAASRVADGAASARQSVAQSTPVQKVADTRERMGDRNFFAAILGGAAAIGAAIGGIFYALRDGNPDNSSRDKTED